MVATLIWVYSVMFFFGIYFLLLFVVLYMRNKEKLNEFPPITKEYSVSIVIPCFNAEKEIGETIKNLLKTKYSQLKQIIVVGDCSTDNSYNVIKEYADKYENVLLVKTPKNTGCAAGAKNYGAKFAETDLIGFSDDDSRPLSDAVEKMIGYFDEKKVAAVTSCVMVQNKKNFMERFQDIDYKVIAWSRKVMDFIGCVYVTNGPLSIYRRDAFEKVGRFDEKNMTEDIEVTWNLLSRGYETRMSYAAKVFTIVPKKLGVWIRQRVRWNVGGLQTLYKYRKTFLSKGENLFSNFVMSYVALSFILALFGFFLFLRYVYLRAGKYVLAIPYIFKGYNPFAFSEFYFPVTILFILGMAFLALSIYYHKIALKSFGSKGKGIWTILTYIFIYRPLYTIPLIASFYKLAKRDIGWYTK